MREENERGMHTNKPIDRQTVKQTDGQMKEPVAIKKQR